MENGADERVRKSLRYSVRDGVCFSLMVGCGELFFTPFAVFLKATASQLGVLGSLPQVLGSVLQLFSQKLTRAAGSRKRLILTGVLIQAFLHLPIAGVFFLDRGRVLWLIVLVSLYSLVGMVVTPAWSSWMGDLVSEETRGGYFGRRNRLGGLASLFSMLAAGWFLSRVTDRGLPQIAGFGALFVAAFTFRIVSWYYLSKAWEPPPPPGGDAALGLLLFFRGAEFKNFRRVTYYLSFMNFGVFLSVPFFTPYMLRDLRMDYFTFTLSNAVIILAKYVTMPFWGRLSDQFGTKKVLVLSGTLMPAVPLLWCFSSDPRYIIALQAYSGFVWAGFELASFNILLDNTRASNRTVCLAYANVVNGLAIFAGGMLGSLLVRWEGFFWSKYLTIFLWSGLLRFLATALFLPQFKEIRSVDPISYGALFSKPFTTLASRGLFFQAVVVRAMRPVGRPLRIFRKARAVSRAAGPDGGGV